MPDDPIHRLEELLSFAQHDIESLSTELRRAFDHIRALQSRLDALEGRTTLLENPIKLPDDERPPHSAGPRST
mgnify:CR=1 FL=1